MPFMSYGSYHIYQFLICFSQNLSRNYNWNFSENSDISDLVLDNAKGPNKVTKYGFLASAKARRQS